MIDRASKTSSKVASQPILTRKESEIQKAINSGQNVEAVIKREQAIEEMDRKRFSRMLELGA